MQFRAIELFCCYIEYSITSRNTKLWGSQITWNSFNENFYNLKKVNFLKKSVF
jgi:hypothetical protein